MCKIGKSHPRLVVIILPFLIFPLEQECVVIRKVLLRYYTYADFAFLLSFFYLIDHVKQVEQHTRHIQKVNVRNWCRLNRKIQDYTCRLCFDDFSKKSPASFVTRPTDDGANFSFGRRLDQHYSQEVILSKEFSTNFPRW